MSQPCDTGDETASRVRRLRRWRDCIRETPGLGTAYRAAVFVVGLACIAGGFALAVLPGPLTIPPVLLGLWIWSTEFRWAHKMFESMQAKGTQAWHHAKRHPVSSTVATVAGLAAAAAGFWAVRHYSLLERAREAAGL